MNLVNFSCSERVRTGCAVFGAAAAVLLCASHAFARQTRGDQIDDLVRDAVARFQEAPSAPPAAAVPRVEQTAGPAVSLTLEQAIQTALDKNLDIAARRLNAQTFDFAIAGARAIYRPTVSALVGDYRQTATPITLLTGGAEVTTHAGSFNGAFTQNLQQGGGNLQILWNNSRVNSNSFFYNFNPAYNTALAAQYTQPILRGVHFDAARHQIAVTAINRSMSELQVKTTVANTIVAVRNAYWDLVLATESIDVAKTSVDLAHQLVQENRKRVETGTMTGLDLITAESQEANDTHVLVVAQGNARTAELALKRLLVTGPDDPLWRETITPADQPNDRLLPIDLEAALRRALTERTDVAEARQQAAANDATLGYLREQTRPQADLVASLGLAGLGGAQLIRAANGGDALSIFSAPIVGTTSGTYFSALGSLGTLKYPTWSIALNFSYPIGYSAAKAEAARAEVQAKEAATQTRQIEVQVVNDVTAAAIEARNTFDEIATARQAGEMAARRLDAEQKKFAAGLSTSYLVVEAQRNLSDARRAVLRAEIAYQKALVEFDRAQQTTLQSAGVTIVAPAGVGTAPVGSGQRALPAPAGSLF